MWLTRFGEYVNRGWKEAASVALIFSLIPFMGWVGIVIMALVTLRKGPQQGLVILFVTALPCALFWSAKFGFLWMLVILSGNVLTWILAIVLRETSDWGKVLFASLLLVIVVAGVSHLLVPDMHGYWYVMLQKLYFEANQDAQMLLQVPTDDVKQYLSSMARMMMPMLLLTQVLMALSSLLVARFWQSTLFNPGGLTLELYQMRFNLWISVILGGLIALSYMGVTAAWDVLPLVVLMFFLSGLVVFHNLVKLRKTKMSFVWLFYGLVVLLFPYSLLIIAGLGIADTFVDFRARIARSTKSGEK